MTQTKTKQFVLTALDIYLSRPLTKLGDSIIHYSRLIAGPILNPILSEMDMAEKWQTQKLRASQILQDFQEAEIRRTKSKAGRAGADARWQSAN